MIDRAALLADLKKQVAALETDLRERAGEPEFDPELRAEWRSAREGFRIAATYESWLDGQLTQAAAAWVLGTVFLRFCEDNRLIEMPYLAGPGERLAIAAERQQEFFEKNPTKTDRDWIIEGFTALSDASPVAAGLFDKAHNPMWQITPSHEAAKALLGFWRRRGEGEDAEVVHDFADPEWNTRFLGDLYQDLSEHAKKTYALLQTPEFVEEFILNLTLDPAIDEFGLDPEPPEACPPELGLPRGLRLIDPTCGSGHFLLGAFKRILAKWEQQAPGADRWDLISRTLYSVHGVDKNPFAVAIARFRLLIAAMQAGDVKRFADAPDFTINIAVGDSLLHGRGAPSMDQGELDLGLGDAPTEPFTYVTEDIYDYTKTVDLLGISSYHVVVGNPPYITVKDKQENENYRVYKSCSGKYALSVPFAERLYQLAIRGGQDRSASGWVGQITANSFMKREFGKKLIQEFFPTIELTHVIDASGAYIPGHGTPTVILIGRRTWPNRDKPIRAVLGIRGEPGRSEKPSEGLVWRAIQTQIEKPGSDSYWISVTDIERELLHGHPWSLSGGGASDLVTSLEALSSRMGSRLKRIGFYGVIGADESMIAPLSVFLRDKVEERFCKRLVVGDEIRDWMILEGDYAFHPYSPKKDLALTREIGGHLKRMWPYRTDMGNRATFSKGTYFSDGRPWYEWHQIPRDVDAHKWALVRAFVSGYNNFVLDRGDRTFKQTAPVIKLPKEASEGEHQALLGVLNSSTACFWLQQVSHNKGEGGGARVNAGYSAMGDEGWKNTYEFSGNKLQEFPLPVELPLVFGQQLDELAHCLAAVEPSSVCSKGVPTRPLLDEGKTEHRHLRGRMIALQEELDWDIYRAYGLLEDNLTLPWDIVPELKLGERAFEIILARKMARGEVETEWFRRHGSKPITEIPERWPEAYRRVVEKRLEIIESRPRTIGLIERPECKRRWATEPWEKKEKAALRNWLLDRCEDRGLWFAADDMGNEQPRPMTINRLADRLRDDADFVSVARLYAGKDAELAAVLMEILDAEHVPYLAALRYKDTGLRKRAQWEKTWELQREEDATGKRLDIAVPPKYASADFLKNSYWSNRGKLDVPKERFISYPGASPDGDGSLLLGWAGWDHREQAHALMTLIDDRASRDGWDRDRLTPLIAGLAEVLPWVRQWHGEVQPEFGRSWADAYSNFLEDQQIRHQLTNDDLLSWRPPKTTRGRRPKTSQSE